MSILKKEYLTLIILLVFVTGLANIITATPLSAYTQAEDSAIVSIVNVSPQSGTVAAPLNATVSYSINTSGATVSFSVDDSIVGSATTTSGINIWKTPSLSDGFHKISITGPVNSVDSNYQVLWDWTKDNTYDLFYRNKYSNYYGRSIPHVIVRLPWFENQSPAYVFGTYPNNEIDFYPAEGWSLLKKDFGTSTYPVYGNPYFILYNKYRGILRLYFNYTYPQQYPYYQMVLHISKDPTSLLSYYKNSPPFNNQYINNNDSTAVSLISQNVVPDGWCFADFNLVGYDSAITSKSSYLSFDLYGMDETNVNNTELTTLFLNLCGFGNNIETSGNSGHALGCISNNFIDFNYLVNELNKKKPDSQYWWSTSFNNLKDLTGSPVSFIQGLSNIAGIADNVIAVLASGNNEKSSTIPVHLSYADNLNYKLNSLKLIDSFNLRVPGSKNVVSRISSQEPDYNSPLGVFSIESKPVIGYCFQATHYTGWQFGSLYCVIDSLQIRYNNIPGLRLVSAKAAIMDTGSGFLTPYLDLDSSNTTVFQPSAYKDVQISENYQLQSPAGILLNLPNAFISKHINSIAVQLKFAYQSSPISVDTVFFLRTYPISVVVDTNISNRKIKTIINDQLKTGPNELAEFSVLQNYPNPFNPVTNINYQLPQESRISLKVYDIIGREVAILTDGIKEAGTYSTKFDGSRLASGIYFLRLIASPQNGSKQFVQTKKMILLK